MSDELREQSLHRAHGCVMHKLRDDVHAQAKLKKLARFASTRGDSVYISVRFCNHAVHSHIFILFQ